MKWWKVAILLTIAIFAVGIITAQVKISRMTRPSEEQKDAIFQEHGQYAAAPIILVWIIAAIAGSRGKKKDSGGG